MAKSGVVPLQGDEFIFIMVLLMLLFMKSSGSHNEYKEELFCGPHQPSIKFPFQLVKGVNDACAYPGFCLYCTQNNDTMLQLPTVKLRVTQIDYEIQRIHLTDPDNCLPVNFLKLDNLAIPPYQFEFPETNHLTYFDCSSVGRPHLRNSYQIYYSLQDMLSCPIYASNFDDSVLELDLTSCTRIFDFVSPVRAEPLQKNLLALRWTKPDCTMCEAKGYRCRWNNNTTDNGVECFNCKGKQKRFHIPPTFMFSAAGSILMGLLTIAGFKIFWYFRRKVEDQTRVEKFLEDYRAEKPTRFTYADVKRITGGFKEKLGEGTHGTVFRGRLSNEILVAVKILNNTEGEGNEFINEVEIMGKIHHINVVRLLGFCAEGLHRALVYHLFPNGSLQSFIFPPNDRDHFLGWEKLQHIALGIAKGIEYLHQGCNRPIIHFDINPHNVLLDDNFTPKISDFGLAKLCSKNPSLVSITTARGTLGYMAPEVFSRNFGNVSYKSDIYSYGMLLLEMVGGRKNVDTSSTEDFHVLYPDWIHNLVDGDVHMYIENESDATIAKKLAIVGLWCIQWQPMNRPSIKYVIQMLETKEENRLAAPPNPFHSTASTSSSRPILATRPLELEVIQE